MSLKFRTLRSGSSGNSLLMVAGGEALLFDLGLPANTALRETLGELRRTRTKLVGAFVTHEHGDHFAPGPLKAMAGLGLPVHAPRFAIDHALTQLHLGYWNCRPTFVCYDEGEAWERATRLGPFTVRPIEVTHNPTGTCFAFHVTVEVRGGTVSAVVATDLCHPRALPAALVDADLIYLESNYDPHLLKMRPNPSSRFHLANAASAALLAAARRASKRPPAHVVLGHLSDRRNLPSLATDTLAEVFATESLPLDFPVTCAPRHHPSIWLEVPPTR